MGFYTTVWLWLYFTAAIEFIGWSTAAACSNARLFAPARLVRRAIAKGERRNGLDRDGLRRGAGSVRGRIRALRSVDGRPGEAARADLRGRRSSVLLPSQVNDDKLERELARLGVELALAIRAGAEPVGLIFVGPRAYGQSYLSEELSVLRAVAAETGRTLDNLRLIEARRKQAVEEEELRKLVAQSN